MRLKEGINLSKKCNGDMISILQGTSKEGTSDVPIWYDRFFTTCSK